MSPLNQSRQPTPGDRFTVLPTPLARGGCVVSGSLSMRRVIKNICAATAITVLLLVVWVVLMKNDGTNHLAFGLSPNDARRPLSSFNVFVTNCTPWQISLYQAELSLAHAGGKATTSDAEFWNGKDMVPVHLLPKEVASFPLQIKTNVEGFRVSFQYSRDAGRLRKAASRALHTLKLRWPRSLSGWLGKHGLWDGQFSFLYESAWTSIKPIALDDNSSMPSGNSTNEPSR